MKRLVYQPHIFLLAIFCLLASYAHGQTGIRTFDYATIAAPTTVDVLRADGNGNIYVAGKYFGNASIDFSPYGTQAPLTDTGTTTDIYIAKYDAGGVLLWLRSAMNDQSIGMEVTDLEVDASGNVFVSGSVTGDAAKFYDATTNHDVSGGAASYAGAYVVKYSSSGAITWVWNKKHATTHYYAKGIEIDITGNIHVGGYTNDGDGNEVSVAVLNSAGAEQSYHALATIANTVTVAAFDRDASGNYYFTGGTNKAVVPEAFVSKFNSSRVHQWNSVVRNFATAGGTGGGFAERGVDIEVDGTGNVFSLFTGNSGTFLVKYNSSGTLQATSFHITANNGNTGRDLALDASGNVIIAGDLRGTTDFDPGAGTVNGGDAFGSYYLASYTSSLAYGWSKILNHSSQTSTRISTSADVDPFGKIHIAYHYDFVSSRKGLITTFSLAGDVTAPTATTLNPADNAANVALSASPQITFSESVSLVNGGTVTIKKLSNATEFESFTIPSAQLTLSGNTLTINPTSDFPATNGTTSYFVTISGGAVRDAAGNFFGPITSGTVWNFSTIVDSSGPVLISRSPIPGATGIDLASNLTIGFTENIVAHTGGSVTLQKLVSGAYTTVQTFSLPSGLVGISGTQATINPSADLSYSSTYQVLVSSNAFKDAVGNFYAGQTAGAWTFTTMAAPDNTPPTVTSFSPADNATATSITGDLTLTFSENITGVSSKVINLIQTSGTTLIESFSLPSAKVQVSGATVTINPTLNLSYNTAYHVTVESGAFEDAAGNDFAGITNATTWNFTTQADPSDLAPFLTTLTPANGATGVNRRTNLQGFFSEPVTLGTSKSLEIRKVSDNSVVEAFTTTSPGISLEGGLVITPTNDLPGSTALYVYFESGFVQDGNSNPMAAVSNSSTWSFTTAAADVAGPALSSSDPGSGEVNVSDELSAIYLQFNEDVSINTGTITVSGSGFNETIDVTTSENIENESDGLIILYLAGQLPNNTAITVSAPVGTFIDEWSNLSPSISFSFTTEPAPDIAGPTVTTYFPTIGETDVPFQRWLSLTFNEEVQYAPTTDKYLRIYNSSDVLVDEVLVVSGSFSTIASGTTLRIYYQKNLEFGVQHYATLDAGTVKDMSGNDFAGIGAGTWYFTVESESYALSRYSNFVPAKNATDVDNSLSQISFNTYFPNKQGGTIALRKVSDDALVKEWAVTDPEVTATGGGHTINATNIPELEYDTEYYVELTGTSFSADGEISWGAFYAPQYLQYLNWNDDNTFWRFTTEAEPDEENPYILQLSPEHNAGDVSISANLQATFNENVLANFGTVNLRKVSGNTLVQSISVGDAAASISGSALIINPTADLEYSTSYYVDISVTGLKDAAGNTFGGLSGAVGWTFTTEDAPDSQPPTITSFSPASGATGVARNNWVYTMTFNEDVQLGTGVNAQITLYQYSNDGQATSETVGNILEVDGNTATIDFNAFDGLNGYNLTYDTKYYITVPSNAIRDLNNNYFAGISHKDVWSFTVQSEPDNTAPTVTDRSPANDAEINPNDVLFSLTFNEPVAKGTGTLQIRNTVGDGVVHEYLATDGGIVVDGDSWYLDFEVDFSAAGGSYYWVIPSTAITDLAGNPFAGFDSADDWYFNTYETEAPTVASFSPANGATGVARNNWVYTVTFNENITAGTGTISLFKYDGDVLVASGAVADLVNVSGSVATIDFNFDDGLNSTTLDYNTKYYISLPATAIKDVNNNHYAGTANKDSWFFTTLVQDLTAPTITASVPDYNFATDVPVNTPFSLTFSEDIQAGEGMVRLKMFGEDVEVIDPNDMTIEGATASYTLSASLPYNSTIQVVVEQDAFRDLAGNPYSNPTNGGNYSFVTESDTDAPAVEQLNPTHRAVQVAYDLGNISIVFDEAIQALNQDAMVSIKKYEDDATLMSVPMSSTSVAIDDKTLTIDFSEEFNFETVYYVLLEAGAIGDLAANEFDGFTSKDAWKFHVQKAVGTDAQAPYLVFFSPENNAEEVAVDEPITLYFNENISLPANGATKALTISSLDNLQFARQYFMAGSNVTATISGNKIEINDPGLHYFTTFKAKINDGVLKDASNNLIGVIETDDYWTFSTSTDPDLSGTSFPDVLEKAPANNATGVYLGIYDWYMKFDAYGNVQPNRLSSGKVRVYKSGSASPVIELSASNTEHLHWYQQDDSDFIGFTMQGGFEPSATYYVKMDEGVIMDFSTGKPMAAINDQVTWTFTTESEQTVLGLFESFTPKRGAEDVAADITEISVEFTKDVYYNNNPLRLKKVEDNSLVKEWYLTSDNTEFEIENNRIVRLKNIALEEGTEYYVQQTFTGDDMILQFDDHYLAPWANDFWTFTTAAADQTAPVISSYDPSVNSTHSGVNDNFLAYFSESVSAVDGKKVEVRRYDNDEVLQSNTFPSDFISIGSGVLVISAENSWPEGTELYVLIDNGAAEDLAGNPFAGITSKDTWKFSIAVPDTAGPEVVSTTPTDGATDVTIASLEIAIEFDEDISSGPDATVVNVSGYGDIDITEFEGASISENYLYLDLSGLLPSETEITVTLPEGVVVDEVGNLSPEYIFSFTTEDNGKENQQITFTEITDKTYGDSAFELEATSDSGLDISFEVVSGPATVAGSTVTITGAGEATIKATQAGNDNYNAASPVERSFSISKKEQVISFVEITDKTYGDAAFELEATSDSGLDISFEVVSGPVTVAGSTVTISGAGEATIKATQAGNDNINGTSPVERSFSISKKAQNISFAEITDKTYGDAAFELEATSDSGLDISFEVVSGPVTVAGSTMTITGAGEATIKATQAGNANYNEASPVERSFLIAKKEQVISVAPIEDKLTNGEPFEVDASVDSELELTYAISGPATLEGTTITLSGEEGAVTVTVSQAGNDNYLPAEASDTFEVTAPATTEKQDQTITFSEIPGKTFGDAAFDLTATASSSLVVTFEVVSGPVTISGKTLTITGAGQAAVKATQVGNDEYNAAPAIQRTFTIAKKAQVVTIASIGDKVTTDAAFNVEATVNSALALTYTVSGPATISGTTVTLSGETGTVTVTVVQAGNENYLSAEAAETFEVTTPAPSTFSISGSAATTANVAFSSGQARLHPKNADGSFATATLVTLSGTGSFSFEGLLAGQYALSVTSTNSQILTTYYDGALSLADATIIEVSNANVSGLSVVMKDKPLPPTGPGSIKGTLLLAADGGRKIVTDGRVMEGTPLAGVTIYLVKAANSDLIATTQTAADGSFQFNNLPLGAYKLLVDYEGKTSIESPEIVITETSLSFDVASEVTDDGIVIVAEPAVTNGVANNQLSPLLTVYPNPSSGMVTLQWDGNMKDILEIIIHNNNGSTVWRGNVAADQQTVDISQHPSGVYFLRLITNKGTAIQKLVIK